MHMYINFHTVLFYTVSSYTCTSTPILFIEAHLCSHTIQYLHVGVLLHGGQTGEVYPRGIPSVLVVVPLLLELTERSTTQSVGVKPRA